MSCSSIPEVSRRRCETLRHTRSNRMRSALLLAAGPLPCQDHWRNLGTSPGDDLLAAAPYFDAGPYEKSPVETCPGVFITGGMRERVFYPKFRARGSGAKACDALLNAVAYHFPILGDTPWVRARWRRRPPLLTKVPLVRWDAKSMYINSSHWVSPQDRGAGNGSPFPFQVPPRLSSTGCSGGSTGSSPTTMQSSISNMSNGST